MSVCGLVDVLIEFNAERKSGAGIVFAVGYGSGTCGIELNSSISSAAVISPNPCCHAASRVLLGSAYHMRQRKINCDFENLNSMIEKEKFELESEKLE